MTDSELTDFLQLAELGVTPASYCHAAGIDRAVLERACQLRWHTTADDVASTARKEPVRLLGLLLEHARNSGASGSLEAITAALERHDALPKQADDAEDEMTDEELSAAARAAHLKLAK